jgi:hypothetical protein
MVYKWKSGSRFSADPEKVNEEIESIPEVTPEHIVRRAEDENTELHKCFTWDDERAAHKWRLQEARYVVQSIITVDDSQHEEIEYRTYESVVVESERQYVQTKKALQDDNLKDQIFSEINAGIGELSQKAKTYRYLAEDEMDTVQHHLNLAREVVAQ